MHPFLIAAISFSVICSSAFAQTQSMSPPTAADRAAATQRETNDLEKARADDAARHDDLRTQAPENGNAETPAPAPSQSLESPEQEHPSWYREPNSYKPCPNDQCPSPPSQK
jgi:hypothetical protein